jgi:glycosyltransferase involved in cell wall biosynthesis
MSGSQLTVVMPVYNAAPWVRTAVGSVLGQSFSDFTLLVIDDGSTDGSAAIVRGLTDPRVRVATQPHAGVVGAMRTALGLVETALVARADADDVCHPRRLEWQVAFLDAHPDVAVVGGAVRRLGRRLGGPTDAARIRWTALYQSPMAGPTLMFRRAAALAVGGYPEDHLYLDDYPFISRLVDRFGAANLAEALVTMTVHETSISRTFSAEALAEGDRVRRANLRRLVGREGAVAALFYMLCGGTPPAGFTPARVAPLLEELLARFHERVGRTPSLARWIGRQLFERALLHGDVPSVLAAMLGVALRLNRRLAFDPRVARALLRQLVWRRGALLPAPR